MMTRILNRNVWTGALVLALGAVAPLAAQTPAATPAGAPQTPTAVGQYIVGTAKPPDVGSPMLNLTMDQAIQRALERNLNIQVQKLNPQINDYALQSTRAFYRPSLSSTFGYSNASTAATSTLDGGALTTTTTQTYNSTLSQQLQFHGASGSVGFANSRTFTNNSFTTVNPAYNSGLTFSFNQPLMQGWNTDTTRTTIKTQEIARQVSDIALRTSIEDTIASVKDAYWDLRAAIETIEIQRQGLKQAQQLVDDNNTKVTIGTLAPLDVLTAKSAAAAQQTTLTQAIAAWQTKELVLKALIVGGPDDDAFKATINPTEKPDFTQVQPDINAAITKALAERTDLVEARKNLQSSEISLALTQDQTRPTLNLAASYAMRGVGGDSHATVAGVSTVTPGGYFDALTSVLKFNVPTWSATLNFTYPIGMVAAKATLARTKLTVSQSRVSLKLSELSVATAVANAALAVSSGYVSMQAATVSRQLAEDTATAEQSKFDVGLSTNFNVVQTLNNLAAARLAELNAMITYIKAVIEFERVQILG
jgi:outer membrane protein